MLTIIRLIFTQSKCNKEMKYLIENRGSEFWNNDSIGFAKCTASPSFRVSPIVAEICNFSASLDPCETSYILYVKSLHFISLCIYIIYKIK